MSDLRFNSIAGSVLAAGVLVMGLREVASIVMHQEPIETAAYTVAIEQAGPATADAEAAPVKPDFGVLFADAAQLTSLVEKGEKAVRVCASCHSFDPGGANQTGPALAGVFGRNAGSHPGFGYSEAMRGYGQLWSYDNLYAYLEAPGKYVAGTSMAFAGLRKSDDRVAVVAYLRSLTPNPPALPAPLPAAAPAAPEAPVEGAVTPEEAAPPPG